MSINQRDSDLMQLRAQIRVMKLVDEWRRQFLGGRFDEQASQALTQEPMTSTAAQEGTINYA